MFPKLADDKLKKERLDICEKCPFKEQRRFYAVCAKCGCVLTAKTSWLGAACPIGKW